MNWKLFGVVLSAGIIGLSVAGPECRAQDASIDNVPLTRNEHPLDANSATNPMALLLQVEPGAGWTAESMGRGDSYRDMAWAVGLGLRQGLFSFPVASTTRLMMRGRLTTGVASQAGDDFRHLWMPIQVGPEIAVRLGSPTDGWQFLPFLGVQYGLVIWTGTSPYWDNLSLESVVSAGVDFSIPGLRSVLLGIAYSRGQVASWSYFSDSGGGRISMTHSQFKICVGIPLVVSD